VQQDCAGAGEKESAVVSQPDTGRPRLDYLDACRALAALAVVLVHAFEQFGLGLAGIGVSDGSGGLGGSAVERAISLLYFGVVRWSGYAVQVFIVISGFSLMLAVAQSQQLRLRGGLIDFVRRRARRILPPYYAALAFSLLVIATIPGMNVERRVYWDLALPALEPRAIVSHLFLVHNYDLATELHLSVNPPMWSIAVEWQIYFLFPLLVLLWRVWGARVTLALALLWGPLFTYLPLPGFPLSHAWFVGLFALGMLGASIAFSRQADVVRWRERLPWQALALVSAVAFVGVGVLAVRFGVVRHVEWFRDSLLAVAVVCVLVHCARLSAGPPTARPSLLLRALQTPPLVRIGLFSYSLYLIHTPILATVALVCLTAGLPILASHAIVFGLGIPLAISVAYVFHLIFERPFLSHAGRRPPASRPAAATTSPAIPLPTASDEAPTASR
jgi:peptidoglycan/LPS O-acetylase OafA/YrhL